MRDEHFNAFGFITELGRAEIGATGELAAALMTNTLASLQELSAMLADDNMEISEEARDLLLCVVTKLANSVMAQSAALTTLLSAATFRLMHYEKFSAKRRARNNGKKKAANAKPNPEQALARDYATKHPGLSAQQIKTRAKLRASERSIRSWLSAGC
ncbi:MAG TPA: hypothetical protein VEY92_05250 [Pseudoxanthomonas sp.]|nr:hypothetical protein [Pseudoxanthomonas sp.]